MRREPSWPGTRPSRVGPPTGLITRSLRITALRITALRTTALVTRSLISWGKAAQGLLKTGLISTGLIMMGALLAAGCGAAAPSAFRPAGAAGADSTGPDSTGPDGTGSPAARTGSTGAAGSAGQPLRASGLEWPPFGRGVHIVMPGWLPADPGEVPAVIAAKNFLLGFLYAEYRGNQDDRWTGFASGEVLGALKANLSQPSVTSESFTGTIMFSHMRAYPDPTTAGAIDVSECFDNAGSRNTSLVTGRIISDRVPADRHYYMNTDVMAKTNGRWTVISVYPVVYYPQAGDCRP
jgi:hypothetical protein